MTPQQIEIVQANFNQISPLAYEMATEFYEHLFTLDSSLRHLFKEEIIEQKDKFLLMLKFAIGTLDRITIFEPSLEVLGRRHSDYGVRDEHYKTVGDALILTLRHLLGAEFTKEIETAWLAAYKLITETMCRSTFQSMACAA